MEKLQHLIDIALPDSFDPARYLLIALVVIASILILSGIFRLGFGQGSTLNTAISSAIAILCIYVLSIVIYSFGNKMSILFAPLPFVKLSGDYLSIFPIFGSSIPDISTQLLNMMILSFLMNLLETWLPKGEKIWGWYFFQFLSIALAICLHYFVDLLLKTVMPEGFHTYAPIILVGLLLLTFLFGCLKLIVGGALAFINPFLGFFYTFFFSNAVGKQLKKAIVTTLILTILVCAFNYFGFTSIYLVSLPFLTYIPVILFGLILWYVISKFL